ncbi:BICD family-like cargo adapter 1 isoform X2 [Hydra vulgaris]|uniref:BICD family-like cargo adapter 1 isoform X2 n=1 Tax=Hydra vulgaris TaxID=6087 RepID=A0ABM4CP37_HYDVU
MITDEEETDNISVKSSDKYNQNTCIERDVYQQIAEKDHYLLLAAEAGKVLLEKNKQITNYYQRLQKEYLHKIEELEQEKHYLKKELTDRDLNYESRMQELQNEFNNLSGQLHKVQKSSLMFERSNQSSFEDLAVQNSSLISELEEMKSYNKELSNQVKALSKRLDEPKDQFLSKLHSEPVTSISVDSLLERLDCNETKKLKEQVQSLLEEKNYLESSLFESIREKDALSVKHETLLIKLAGLEREIHFLKLQVEVYQNNMSKIQKKNEKLKDRLQLCNSFHQLPAPSQGVSLFEEMSFDTDFHKTSSPKKNRENEIENVSEYKMTYQSEYKMIYQKLTKLKNKLLFGSLKKHPYENIDVVNSDTIIKIIDMIDILIQNSVMLEGSQINEDYDHTSQNESNTSDRDIEALEQQVNDLNHRLNIATNNCELAKKDLSIAQASALLQEEVLQSLQIKVNSHEREIESLRKEREIMLADISVDEKFKAVIQDRDEAFSKVNFVSGKLEESYCDIRKLNSQLLTVVEQKYALSEQLEEWQFDMASLIDQQLTTKIKDEQWKSRKRSGSITPARLFASKIFSSRNNSKNPSPNRVSSPVSSKTK